LIWKGKGYGKKNEKGISFKNDDGRLVKVGKGGDDNSGKSLSGNPDNFDRFSKLNKFDYDNSDNAAKKKQAADIEKQKAAEERKEELRKKIRARIIKNAKSELDPKVRIPNKEVRKELTIDEFEEKKANEAILELLPDDLKKKSVLDGSFDSNKGLLTAYGLLYGGRVNSGFLKNNFSMIDRDQLIRNIKNLKELYDEADPKKVERGVRKVRKVKISEEDLIESYNALPPKMKQYLNGAGNGGNKHINNGKKINKKTGEVIGPGHFLGYVRENGTVTTDVSEFENDDYDETKPESDTNKRWKTGKPPEEKRGNVGNKQRGLHVWRVFKEQGGVCAYSGLPLVLEEMDLEHVVGLKNKDTGDPNDIDVKRAREHGANHVLCLSKFNQTKKDKSMDDWIEDDINSIKDKTKAEFDAIEKGKGKVNEYKSQTTQTSMTLMDEVHYEVAGGGSISKTDYDELPENKRPKLNKNSTGGPLVSSANFGENVTVKILEDMITEENKKYKLVKDALKEQITDKDDIESINGIKTKIGKRIFQSLGLSGNFEAEDRRTGDMGPDAFYQGYALAMADASAEDRKLYKQYWTEARKEMNKRDGEDGKSGSLVYGKKNNTTQKKEFVKILLSKKRSDGTPLISQSIRDDKRFKKHWNA